MPTQYSNHRDTPLRRFNAFWWGLACFGLFGLMSTVVDWATCDRPDVESLRAADRHEIKSEVDTVQSAMLPAAGSLEKVAGEIKSAPKASGQFVPGTASHQKAMDALSNSTGGGEGFKLFTDKTCATCHGADANTPISPAYPKLAGQNAEYLLAQMKDFHEGKRTNGQSAVMKPMMALVSEQEQKTLADWMAGLKPAMPTLADDAGKALFLSKGCIACHGMDANSPIMPLYPRLAGQNTQYAIDQMKAIKDGTRSNGQSAAMKGIMAGVSDEEIKLIAEWLTGKK
ncbi:MAG: cytochrome c [Verrucomicrobiae bacterium]|nr:cytochrome c [Verrucomicrobiae bacterium]NNJ41713.1 cytochrome c [Akkermansiaceae bacterium]